jgi:hypothetical protein
LSSELTPNDQPASAKVIPKAPEAFAVATRKYSPGARVTAIRRSFPAGIPWSRAATAYRGTNGLP